jgi:hypothetical protein
MGIMNPTRGQHCLAIGDESPLAISRTCALSIDGWCSKPKLMSR